MFSIFSLNSDQPKEAQSQTELQQRLHQVIETFSKDIPLPARLLLNNHLDGLQANLSDELIHSFIGKIREVIHFIETGEVGVADDDSDQAE